MLRLEMRPTVAWIALMFGGICVLWSLLVPIGEAPDENSHLQYAQYIHDFCRLPDGHAIWSGKTIEGFQPPLYHVLIASLIGIVGFSLDNVHWVLNPHFDTVSTSQPNLYDNAATRAATPRETLVAYHLLRLPNALFAALTFWWLWMGLSRLFQSESLALGAVSVWAFMTQTTHMGGVVGNDMLAACFSALAFLYFVKVRVSGLDRHYGYIAVLLGLAIMTKMTGLFVYGGVCLALLLNGTWRRRPWAFLTVAVLPVLIGGWAVLRSLQLHIPPVETKWLVTPADGMFLYLKSWIIALLRALQSGLWTTIGQPGWGWLMMPTWYYGAYVAVAILTAIGIINRVREHRERLPLEAFAYLIGNAVFLFMTMYWFRESSERLAGRLFYPFAAGPLALICWVFKNGHTVSTAKPRSIFISLFVGIALIGLGLFGGRIIETVGSSMASWGHLVMSSSHYYTVTSMNLSVCGYALLLYGVWLGGSKFLRRLSVPQWSIVVIPPVVVNILLLVFRVQPYFS